MAFLKNGFFFEKTWLGEFELTETVVVVVVRWTSSFSQLYPSSSSLLAGYLVVLAQVVQCTYLSTRHSRTLFFGIIRKLLLTTFNLYDGNNSNWKNSNPQKKTIVSDSYIFWKIVCFF